MQNRTARIWESWIIGVLILGGVNVSFSISTNCIGLPTWINCGETIVTNRGFYDEKSDGQSTALGIWIIFVSVTLGARAGMAIFSQGWNGGVSHKENLQLAILLICVTLYALILTVAWKVFGHELMRWPTIVSNALELGTLGLLAYLGYHIIRTVLAKGTKTAHTNKLPILERCRVEESPQHVIGDFRDVVVETVPAQAAGP